MVMSGDEASAYSPIATRKAPENRHGYVQGPLKVKVERRLKTVFGVLLILAGLFCGMIAFLEAGGSDGFGGFNADRLLSSDDARLAVMGFVGLFFVASIMFFTRPKRQGVQPSETL